LAYGAHYATGHCQVTCPQLSLFADQFDYRIEVEGIADQEAILIPPMLLQPFAGQKEKGQLNIKIKKNHKALHCVIEDNGRGFQDGGDNYPKRPLSTIINKERLEILGRQTKTDAHINIIDKKATTGESSLSVERHQNFELYQNKKSYIFRGCNFLSLSVGKPSGLTYLT
jgi:hypothetical protein